MRIYNRSGDIPFKQFTFPDGQRHLQILQSDNQPSTIETAIRSADDLMDVLLAKSALTSMGSEYVDLDIRYLLGARMDRRIAAGHPATLEVIARQLMSAGFRRIRILDPHSSQATSLLNAQAVLPMAIVTSILDQYHIDRDVVVIPDAGATERVMQLTTRPFRMVQARKHRQSETGVLSPATLENADLVKGKRCLILDDICDGGATFVGLAKVLRDAGAVDVDLFVTHGIFSKGLPLSGIVHVYTTNSYKHHVDAVTFPISMKDIK